MNTIKIVSSIELWPLDRLVPYANNARTHSQAQVAQIAASIREFGFTNPILVDPGDGIVAGHARLLAARQLQLPLVPVIVLAGLTDIQKRAYILADNQLALNAGWDDELLASELAQLEKDAFDVSLLGFSEQELADLAAEVDGNGEDAPPDPVDVAFSRLGDLWVLDSHRLLCGDALDPAALASLMQGALAQVVFTDPPYNVNYTAGAHQPIANDHLGASFPEFLLQACRNLLQFSDGAVYICMSSSELHSLHHAFTQAGGHWSTFLIWAKNSFALGWSDYQRQYEPILYGWKEGGKHQWTGGRSQGDVWNIDKPSHNDRHPTMKPVELIERAIRNSSRRGDLVLDPFAGSGSTLIAAEKLGRRARLLEIEPLYVDVIIRRWQQITGKRAVREGDGAILD